MYFYSLQCLQAIFDWLGSDFGSNAIKIAISEIRQRADEYSPPVQEIEDEGNDAEDVERMIKSMNAERKTK